MTATNWQDEFPMHEEFEDFSGRRRPFVITCHEGGLGFTVRASEEGNEQLGYQFAAYSETSPYSALTRVREKTRVGLATQYITREGGCLQMLHDELNGRIMWSAHGGVTLVVDGIALSLEDLAAFLSTREGSEFQLRIVDGIE